MFESYLLFECNSSLYLEFINKIIGGFFINIMYFLHDDVLYYEYGFIINTLYVLLKKIVHLFYKNQENRKKMEEK